MHCIIIGYDSVPQGRSALPFWPSEGLARIQFSCSVDSCRPRTVACLRHANTRALPTHTTRSFLRNLPTNQFHSPVPVASLFCLHVPYVADLRLMRERCAKSDQRIGIQSIAGKFWFGCGGVYKGDSRNLEKLLSRAGNHIEGRCQRGGI